MASLEFVIDMYVIQRVLFKPKDLLSGEAALQKVFVCMLLVREVSNLRPLPPHACGRTGWKAAPAVVLRCPGIQTFERPGI